MKDNEEVKGVRQCLNCGVRFSPSRSWHKFHSTKCRTEYFWKHHKVVKVETQTTERTA